MGQLEVLALQGVTLEAISIIKDYYLRMGITACVSIISLLFTITLLFITVGIFGFLIYKSIRR